MTKQNFHCSILGQNDQEKQKLSPLVSLAKNDKEKTQTFTIGILGQKCSKIKNFQRWYPWPKKLKNKKFDC